MFDERVGRSLPVGDVWDLPHMRGSFREDNSASNILETGAHHELLAHFGCTGLNGSDEMCADPNTPSIPRQVGRKAPSVEYGTSTDSVTCLPVGGTCDP